MLDLLRNFSSSFRKNQKVEVQSYYLFTLSVSIGLISCSAIAMCLVHTICSPVQQKESSSHRRNFRLISPRVCLYFLRLTRGEKLHKNKIFHCKLYRRQISIPSYRKGPGANKIVPKSDPSFDFDTFCSDA